MDENSSTPQPMAAGGRSEVSAGMCEWRVIKTSHQVIDPPMD